MTQTQPQHQPKAQPEPQATGDGPAPAPRSEERIGAEVKHPTTPTYQEIEAFGYQRFTNREQSRLDFGSRLLDLAEDDVEPLLERVKFLCISCANLDEFFEIRVASLKELQEAGAVQPGPDGMSVPEQLKAIREGFADPADRGLNHDRFSKRCRSAIVRCSI